VVLCRPWNLLSRGTNHTMSGCGAVKLPDP